RESAGRPHSEKDWEGSGRDVAQPRRALAQLRVLRVFAQRELDAVLVPCRRILAEQLHLAMHHVTEIAGDARLTAVDGRQVDLAARLLGEIEQGGGTSGGALVQPEAA